MIRQLSDSSIEVLDFIKTQNSTAAAQQATVLALHAIKWATSASRISAEEAATIKSQIRGQLALDETIVCKLSVGEQSVLRDLPAPGAGLPGLATADGRTDTIDQACIHALNFIERRELDILRRERVARRAFDAAAVTVAAAGTAGRRDGTHLAADLVCVCCFESRSSQHAGLCCNNQDGPQHFCCDVCLTSWVSCLNEQRISNPDAFR